MTVRVLVLYRLKKYSTDFDENCSLGDRECLKSTLLEPRPIVEKGVPSKIVNNN